MLRLDKIALRLGAFTLKADLTIERGAKVAIIGPSGGGKSSLLSVIAGFTTLETGGVSVGDTDITDLKPGKRPVSLLFQDNNLFPHLTIMQNVGLGLRPDLKLTSQDKIALEDVLERVGLAEHADKKPAALSGGQQQRAALARALLRDKPVLMLDEPFAALGPALKVEMLNLVASIVKQSGATLLMVTHDPNDAKRIADETILVTDSVAHAPVATDELFSNPPPALQEYLG